MNDPAAPENAGPVAAHMEWWSAIWAHQAKRGDGLPCMVEPEFGPASYMPLLPYTMQPVADLWSVNLYMAGECKKQFESMFA